MRYTKHLLKQTVIDASPALFSDIGIARSLEMIEAAAEIWSFPLAAWRVREHRVITRNLLRSVEHPQPLTGAAQMLWQQGYCCDRLAELTFEILADLADNTGLVDAHLAFLNSLTPSFDGVHWAMLCRAAVPQTPIRALLASALSDDEIRTALDFAVTAGIVTPATRLLQDLPAQRLRPQTIAFARLKDGEHGDLLETERSFAETLRSQGPERVIEVFGSAAATLRGATFRSILVEMAIAVSPETFRQNLSILWQAGIRTDQLIKLLDDLHIPMRADPDNPRWEVLLEVIAEQCTAAERTLAALELLTGGARRDRMSVALRVAPRPLHARLCDRLWEYAVATHDEANPFVHQLLDHGVAAASCSPLAKAICELRNDKEVLSLLG